MSNICKTVTLRKRKISGGTQYSFYLDSVYCIPENVEKRKMYWEKAGITK